MVLLGAATCCVSPNVPKQDAAIYGWRRLEDQVAAAHEFYDYADEHFGSAETAKTEHERAIFLQMAAAWLEVAQQWEAAKGVGERVSNMPKSLAGSEDCSIRF